MPLPIHLAQNLRQGSAGTHLTCIHHNQTIGEPGNFIAGMRYIKCRNFKILKHIFENRHHLLAGVVVEGGQGFVQ